MHFSSSIQMCRSLIFIFVISSSMSCTVAQLTCRRGQSCSGPLCPNTIVQYMCNISAPLISTRWTIPVQQCGGVNTTFLLLPQASGICCGLQTVTCGPFVASNVPPNGDTQCTSSILSVTITSDLNGTSIICYNSDTNTQYLIGSATILVLSPPGPPSVLVVPGLNGLVVMWTSYGGGHAYYNITLMGAGICNSTNLTSTQFAGLPSDTLFSIAVVAINCAGYATTYVNTATLPLPPINIRVQKVLLGTITQLTITWTAVGGNVTGYQIMSSSGGYNVTASPLAKDSCLGSDCVYNQNVKTTGALYTVTMASINGGGVGPWSDPVQDTNQQTSAVSVGVGVGIGLGVPILIIAVTMAMLFYWLFCRHKNSIYMYMHVPQPSVQEEQLVTFELRLYAMEWHGKPPGYESYCIPIYIKSPLNDCVWELKDNPEDGHHVVIRRRGLPPHDSQLWYLIDQSNDNTFLIVSKLNGKVLSCESGENPSKDSVLWKKDGDLIRSVPRENYVLGISGGHREPGYPVVLCGMKKDDKSQLFDERPAYIQHHTDGRGHVLEVHEANGSVSRANNIETKDPLDLQCSDDHLPHIATLHFNWRVVGVRLLDHQTIEDIDREEKDEQVKRDRLLLKWQQMKGSGATYRELVNVFECVQNRKAAEAVKSLVHVAGDRLPQVLQVTEEEDKSAPSTTKEKKFSGRCNECGCTGKCDLKQILEKGCTNSAQQFPYLRSVQGLTEGEQQFLLKRLAERTEAIRLSLGHLKCRCSGWLLKHVSLHQFKEVLNNVDGAKGTKMLEQNRMELDAANAHSQLMEIIYRHVSWYNYQLLQHVMQLCTEEINGQDEAAAVQEMFKSYEEVLIEYYKQLVFECPPPSDVKLSTDSKYFVLKIELEFKELTLGHLHDHFQHDLQTILNIYPHALHFRLVQEGCTELVYIIPKCVHKVVFPLSNEQWEKLLKLGVIELSTEGFCLSREKNVDVTSERAPSYIHQQLTEVPGPPVQEEQLVTLEWHEKPPGYEIIPTYYIECQKKCGKATSPSHDSKGCTECNRCVQITDTAIVVGTPYTPQSTDDQRWYIEYLHGQSDRSFLIMSKLNGKALYCNRGSEGLEVKTAERNDEDESQHWKRDGSYIVSKRLGKMFFKQPGTHLLHLTDKNDDAAFLSSENKDRVTFAIKNCSTYFMYIQHHTDDRVLDLEHEANGSVSKANGAAAVFNPKAAPPTDSQQWYLHPLSNGHYLVASWLHGKVLTYQVDGGGHTKCFVSNSNGGEDQMWKKEEDGSIASVKYPYVVGRCVDITVDDL